MSANSKVSGVDYTHNRDVYDAYWSQRWRRAHTYSTQGKVRRFRTFLAREGLLDATNLAVFDQGFGMGLMLFCFGRSCRLAGLELAPSAVQAAAADATRLGFRSTDFRVFQPGVPYPKEWMGQFDVVISSHVLEHIEDPRPAARSLYDLLRPGGHACVVVPIHEQPGEDPNHFHQFSANSIRELLSGCGFEFRRNWETDRLWHLMTPVAYGMAKKPTRFLRIASVLWNLCGFLPGWVLGAIDSILGVAGVPTRQCFTLVRKPVHELQDSAHRPQSR